MSPSGLVRFWLLSQGRAILPLLIAASAVLALLGGGAVAADPPADMVEVVDQRTANSKTFRRSDGGTTKRLYAGNVHYREDGKWKAIDPTLIAAAPAEQDKGFGWRMKSNGFNVLAKRKLDDGYLRTDVLGRPLEFSLRGARPAQANVRGSQVSYAEALPGVDLRSTSCTRRASRSSSSSSRRTRSRASPSCSTRRPGPTSFPRSCRAADWAFRMRRGGRPLFVLTDAYATDEPLGRSRPGAADPAPGPRPRRPRDDGRHEGSSAGGFEIVLAVDEAWPGAEGPQLPRDARPHARPPAAPTKAAEFDASCGACEGWDCWARHIRLRRRGGQVPQRLPVRYPSSIPPSANVTNAQLGLFNPSDSRSVDVEGTGGGVDSLDVPRACTRRRRPGRPTSRPEEPGSGAGNTTSIASYALPAGAPDGWLQWDIKRWRATGGRRHQGQPRRAGQARDRAAGRRRPRRWSARRA